jgi:aryl-alcohol dehydrogenase-like predicted oxidoreductase
MTSLDSYITLGRSGLRVSPLSLGTMTFGEDNGWGASPETSEAMLAEYLDRGGNVVDTANIYTNGHSEKIVGDFFAALPGLRERVVPSTKFFANLYPGDPSGGGAGRKALIAQLEESLRRLQTDYVDLYWLGTPCPDRGDAASTRRSDRRGQDPLRRLLRRARVGRRAGPDDRPLARLGANHRAAARVLASGTHVRGRATADGRSARHGRPALGPARRRPAVGQVRP